LRKKGFGEACSKEQKVLNGMEKDAMIIRWEKRSGSWTNIGSPDFAPRPR
jgi:hypothetical protein